LWLVFAAIFSICSAARAHAESRIDRRLSGLVFFASIAVWFTPAMTAVLAVPVLAALIPSAFASPERAVGSRLAPALVLLVMAVAALAVSRRIVHERSLIAGVGRRPDTGTTTLAA